MPRPKTRAVDLKSVIVSIIGHRTTALTNSGKQDASKGLGKTRFDLEKSKLLLKINKGIHFKVIDQLDALLSNCQKSLSLVKKNYDELVKLSVYLQGEVDAYRIRKLEEQEEALNKAIKCLSNNKKILREMNLNSTKMVSCPALTDNSWPDLKELVEFIFLKEQLVKQISNYKEAQEIINSKAKSSSTDEVVDKFGGKPDAVKDFENSLKANSNALESQLKVAELQIINLKKQFSSLIG